MDADMTPRARLEAAVVAAMTFATGEMRWGVDDCALWCADVVRDALGYDPVAPFRGRYKTRRGAMRVMGRKGLLGAMRAAARRHKWKRVSPTMAQPGDAGLVWTMVEDKPVLATCICRAPGWFVGRNDLGFTVIRAEDVAGAWSVLDDHQPGARANLGSPGGMRRPGAVAVCHEPVSTVIGLTALIASLGASTAVAGAIGGAIISATLSIGFSLLASLLQPHKGAGSIDSNLANTASVQSVQVTERQPIPFKRIILGSAYVGGALFFEQVKPPYLTQGILINYGEIAGVDGITIGTDRLNFATIEPNITLTPLAVVGQRNYAAYLRASLRYGAADQAIDTLLATDYPSLDTEFRQRGNATAVMRYHFGGATQADFLAMWGQAARPSAFFTVRGVVAYDPRDPTQILADETTWQWTNNATLIQAYYLTRSWGGRIPTAKIRWDKIADSADYDDETIVCKDGSRIRRHTIDGVVTLNQRPSDVISKLLTANRAYLLESGGRIWIESSRPKTAVATIYDALLTGGIRYQATKAKRDYVNKLQVRFVAPNQDYQVVDGPILDRTDLQATDGEVLPATLALEYTLDTSVNCTRAQRLQKAFLENARLGRSITCTVSSALLGVASDELIGNVVTFDSDLFNAANGSYLVTSVGFSDDFTSISLALTEYDSSIETNWNPTTDEQDFVLADLDVT